MMKRTSGYTDGFTFIELSIVLIIVAFSIGGILIGRDLFHAAGLRQTVADLHGLESAINMFNTQYNCLPGDCTNAVNLGLGGQNGNGNSYIEPVNWMSSEEAYYVLLHLSSAGLIKGSYAVGQWYPTALGQNTSIAYVGFFNWSDPGAFHLGRLTEGTNDAVTSITPQDALDFDTKIDDGMPEMGKVRGMGGGSLSSYETGLQVYDGEPGCILAQTTHTYNTTVSTTDCIIVYCVEKNCVY